MSDNPSPPRARKRKPEERSESAASRPLEARKPLVPSTKKIEKDARAIAWLALGRVLHEKAYASLALDAELAGTHLDNKEVALANEILMGTLRYLNQLDQVLVTIPTLNLKTIPAIIVDLLRVSVYQLLHLGRVPPYAIVNEAAKKTSQAGYPRLVGMVNASLRKIDEKRPTPFAPTGNQLEDLTEETVLPQWLAGRWLKQFGYEEARKLGLMLLKPAPLTIRVNMIRTTPEELAAQLAKLGYVTKERTPGLPTLKLIKGVGIVKSTLYQDGYFYLQDESALLAPLVLNPPSGSSVIDLCCGLGGKTTFLAQLMDNVGEVVAIDQNQSKLKLLIENAVRMGVSIIRPVTTNILECDCPPAKYVLLDSPCSNLGTIRHRPELKWSANLTQLAGLVKLEKELLAKAATLTMPNGWLVYSTCTMEQQEDEDIVNSFLSDHPEFEVVDAVARLPEALSQQWHLKGPFVRTFPHICDCDGVFVALFKRKC